MSGVSSFCIRRYSVGNFIDMKFFSLGGGDMAVWEPWAWKCIGNQCNILNVLWYCWGVIAVDIGTMAVLWINWINQFQNF